MPKSAEFILQPDRIVVILVEPFGPGYGALLGKLQEDQRVQPLECVSAMDALSVIRHMSSCLVIANVSSSADVAQHLSLLKLLGPQIRKREVRVLITATQLVQETHERLLVAGCSEILTGELPLKAMLFKVDVHLRALPQLGDKSTADRPTSDFAGHDSSRAGIAQLAEERGPEGGVRLVAALDFASDCWIMAGGGAKRTAGQWLIKLNGPPPAHGRWSLADTLKSGGGLNEAWQWKPTNSTQDAFITERGTWLFSGGRKPEYHSGLWQFVGTQPLLHFVEKEEIYGIKFSLNEKGSLLIARDSTAALEFLRQIRAGTLKRYPKGLQAVAARPLDVANPFAELSASPSPALPEASAPDFSEAPLFVPPPPAPPQVFFVDALTLASDCWLIEERPPKRVRERWLVRLLGPGPSAGRWVPQSEGADSSRKSSPHWSGSVEKWWQWIPSADPKNAFVQEHGSWYFFGLTPYFAEGIWSFASSAPELAFYCESRSLGSKFCSVEGESLQVCHDSGNALSALPMILESLEPPAPEKQAPLPPVLVPALPPAESLEAIAAPEPPGPSISPLALAFLVSELMTQRGLERRSVAQRYCAYVSASCGGLNAELWSCHLGSRDWSCVGTPSLAVEGQYGTLARGGAGLFEQQGVPVYVTLVCNGAQGMIGALIIGGRGAQSLDGDYAKAAARVAFGILQSFAEEGLAA